MAALLNSICKMKIWKDTRGQELVEIALFCGVILCACGIFSTAFAADVGRVFSKVTVSLERSYSASPRS